MKAAVLFLSLLALLPMRSPTMLSHEPVVSPRVARS